MSRRPSVAACLVAASLALLLHPAAAGAALFVPTKTSDGADGVCDETDCSLREAVIAANERPGEDVILLAAATYRLDRTGAEDAALTGDLDVTDDLLLAGEGPRASFVDGGAIDRVLQVASGVALEVRDVTLRNGRVAGFGGGIANAGALTLRRVMLRDHANVSGGGASGGGAVHSGSPDSRLVVLDSTMSSNRAEGGNGGAILAGGETTLSNVTLARNSATGSGGALYFVASGRAEVNDATIFLNSSGGRGGGVFSENNAFLGQAPRVSNTLIAGNHAGEHPDCSGSLDSWYDLIGDATGCFGPSVANHDLVGTAVAPIDPDVLDLGDHGGPTWTVPIRPGSPAHDAGDPAPPGSGGRACTAADQRGVTRPAGARCDIGAFEATAACVAGGEVLCLGGGRFRVRASFDTGLASGAARAVALTSDSGYFWFFDPANVEVTVKVLDGCALNDRFWVFSSGMTNVRVDLTVTDTQTGSTKTHTNPLGRVYRTRLDTTALPCN